MKLIILAIYSREHFFKCTITLHTHIIDAHYTIVVIAVSSVFLRRLFHSLAAISRLRMYKILFSVLTIILYSELSTASLIKTCDDIPTAKVKVSYCLGITGHFNIQQLPIYPSFRTAARKSHYGHHTFTRK